MINKQYPDRPYVMVLYASTESISKQIPLGREAVGNLCQDRVAIASEAGKGVGRKYALLLATQGARIVINDLGTSTDVKGKNQNSAQRVVDEIKANSGEVIGRQLKN